MNLILTLERPKLSPESRGRNDSRSIILIIPNIWDDYRGDFDGFIKGINRIYTIEMICSNIVVDKWIGKWIGISETLCYDKNYCPIAEILNKHSYRYVMNLSPRKY